jgi:hypothetical protein
MSVLTIPRRDFKPLPAEVAATLNSLAEYGPAHVRPPANVAGIGELTARLIEEEPMTVILLSEPLAPEHWRHRKYVEMKRVQLVSELDETVLRHFSAELNDRMAKYLESHSDPDDVHLRKLIRSFHPQARRLLREEYREMYPRAWARKWRSVRHTEPRIRVEKKRRHELPAPLGHWEPSVPQQFYFLRRSRGYARGCSLSSGSRGTHSLFALALAGLRGRVAVPGVILLYDRDNILKLVHAAEDLVLVPDSIGSNCDVPHSEVARQLAGVTLVDCSLAPTSYDIATVTLAEGR